MPTLDDWTDEEDATTAFDPSASHNLIADLAKGSVTEIKSMSAAGRVLVSFTNQTTWTVADIPFGKTFPAVPAMGAPNIVSASAATGSWIARAINITTTSFDLFLQRVSGSAASWSNVPVTWNAKVEGS